jgi:hypothetical protein
MWPYGIAADASVDNPAGYEEPHGVEYQRECRN